MEGNLLSPGYGVTCIRSLAALIFFFFLTNISETFQCVNSEIVYTPPKLEQFEYVATTYRCPECRDTKEPLFIRDYRKPALITGNYVSESLSAYILYRKYALYVPLYRQEQEFLQLGAPIGSTSLYCGKLFAYEWSYRKRPVP